MMRSPYESPKQAPVRRFLRRRPDDRPSRAKRRLIIAAALAVGGFLSYSFVLSDTPFGFDWERDLWPEPYKGAIFVALHGSFYTQPPWSGARIVFARVDPTTHMPLEGWRDFVGGFGCGMGERCCEGPGAKSTPSCQIPGSVLDRPSDVTFAPDGRMFFADDQGGGVYWIAPRSLARPNP